MLERNLIERRRYLDRLLAFRDTDLVKVITGVRRCGKSSLLALVRKQFEREGAPCLFLNLESKKSPVKTEDDLYAFFSRSLESAGRSYVFIDEPQRIEGWQNAVNALRVDYDCDIYLTGSNAYLLSSELSTYLSGRHVEIQMLPLSFAEYALFCGIQFSPGSAVALGADGHPVLFDDLFRRYLFFGGMPATAALDVTQGAHAAYMSSMYDAVAVRDVINRERERGKSRVTDPRLLRSLATFLADNIGNECSSNGIAAALSSGGVKTTNKTVDSYLSALNEAYLFYRAVRYDLHGKALLKTNPKEYIVDLGLRSYLGGYRASDLGRLFENAVYLQFLYEGWTVHVGKLYSREVDFVAVRDGERRHVQVTDNMMDERTRERELAPLRSIRDAFPKMVVVREGTYGTDVDGIRIVGAREFFLPDAAR